MPRGEVIVVDGLSKSYGEIKALDNVSFTVARGEIFGYLGPNGAGKTTTIRVLMGFVKPDRGRVSVMGFDVPSSGFDRARRRIGFVPGEFGLPQGLRGLDVVRLVSKLRGAEPVRLDKLLELFPLDLERRVDSYSTGMKQLLAVILAFMHEPELVLMDEPTAGLDPLMRVRLLEFLRREAERGVTIFFSSHVLNEVQMVADRVALLREGRLVALEDVGSLLKKRGKLVTVQVDGEVRVEGLELEGVEILEVRGSKAKMLVSAEALNNLMRRLSSYRLADLEVRDLRLEEIFQYYYER